MIKLIQRFTDWLFDVKYCPIHDCPMEFYDTEYTSGEYVCWMCEQLKFRPYVKP